MAQRPITDKRGWLGLAVLVGAIWGGTQLIQWSQRGAQGQAIRAQHPDGRITLYTSRTCVYCDRAMAWLRAEAIPFRECQIESDAQCAERYAQMGSPGTPVVQVDSNQITLGFDPDWLARALAQRPGR